MFGRVTKQNVLLILVGMCIALINFEIALAQTTPSPVPTATDLTLAQQLKIAADTGDIDQLNAVVRSLITSNPEIEAEIISIAISFAAANPLISQDVNRVATEAVRVSVNKASAATAAIRSVQSVQETVATVNLPELRTELVRVVTETEPDVDRASVAITAISIVTETAVEDVVSEAVAAGVDVVLVRSEEIDAQAAATVEDSENVLELASGEVASAEAEASETPVEVQETPVVEDPVDDIAGDGVDAEDDDALDDVIDTGDGGGSEIQDEISPSSPPA